MYVVATAFLSRSWFSHLQNGDIICPVLETIRISSCICHSVLRDVLDNSDSRKIAMCNLKSGTVVVEFKGQWCFWTTGLPRCGSLLF